MDASKRTPADILIPTMTLQNLIEIIDLEQEDRCRAYIIKRLFSKYSKMRREKELNKILVGKKEWHINWDPQKLVLKNG